MTTSPSWPRWPRSPRRSKNSRGWSSPRTRHWGSSRATRSRSRSYGPRSPRAPVPRCTSAEISSICAGGRISFIPARLRPFRPRGTRRPTGWEIPTTTAFRGCTALVFPTRRCSRFGRRIRRRYVFCFVGERSKHGLRDIPVSMHNRAMRSNIESHYPRNNREDKHFHPIHPSSGYCWCKAVPCLLSVNICLTPCLKGLI
mmetsp:Transcript_6814/g.20279  ORF Transcript_6814/g.20279 Transcript_6814/m.20279 type:complete len:200 (-) Transcript_6814:1050-1649(-)